MAFERRTTQYQPNLPPAGLEGGDYLFDELQRIANVFELVAQGRIFEEKHAEPDKPRTGQVAFADGTDWNPGSGRGLYYYDEDNSSWNFIA